MCISISAILLDRSSLRSMFYETSVRVIGVPADLDCSILLFVESS